MWCYPSVVSSGLNVIYKKEIWWHRGEWATEYLVAFKCSTSMMILVAPMVEPTRPLLVDVHDENRHTRFADGVLPFEPRWVCFLHRNNLGTMGVNIIIYN